VVRNEQQILTHFCFSPSCRGREGLIRFAHHASHGSSRRSSSKRPDAIGLVFEPSSRVLIPVSSWRRERDSNPRGPLDPTRFPGERTRPTMRPLRLLGSTMYNVFSFFKSLRMHCEEKKSRVNASANSGAFRVAVSLPFTALFRKLADHFRANPFNTPPYGQNTLRCIDV
jgi:hypothetical protein